MLPDEPILSPEELEALTTRTESFADAPRVSLAEEPAPSAIAYDLTNEDRPVTGHLPALDLIHTSLADEFAASLRRAARMPVRVRAEDTQMTKMGTCLSYIPTASCIGVIELVPLNEPALIVIDLNLLLSLMTISYGGDGPAGPAEDPSADRPMSVLERRFARSLFERFGETLRVAWEPFAPMQLEVRGIETSPRFASIVPSGDIVASAIFEVTAGAHVGHIQLIIPHGSLRPHHEALQSAVRLGDSARHRSWRDRLEEQLREIEVSLIAELGSTVISMGRLSALRPGHILRLASDREGPLTVFAEGIPRLLGQLTVDNENIAIRVGSWIGVEPATGSEVQGVKPPQTESDAKASPQKTDTTSSPDDDPETNEEVAA